jgi:acyl-CoA synthetase (AMP-forming)/AMP-acid ligase II/acyl carrier protein
MNPASMSTKNVPALSDQDRQTPGTQTTDASRTNPSAQLTISGCLAGAARLYGKRQALAAPFSKSLNYRQLFGQITSSVEALNNLGIGRGDRLALVLSGGLHTGMTFLGVAAGATCAPLNPRYREQEFASLFTVLRPKAVIVGTECRSEAFLAANQLSVPVIELSALKTGSQKFVWHGKKLGAATQGGFAKAEDTALMLFTSGTTAQPKLVPLTHINLLTSARQIAAGLKLIPDDRCLNIMPLFHVHGLVAGLLSTLLTGGSAVCPSEFRAGDFFSWIEEFRPTWYTAVPTMHQAILAQAENHAETISKNPFRFIRSCSAPLPQRLAANLETVFRAPVIEAYGTTEAAHQIASNPLPPAIRKPGSVGKPTGAEIAIIDEAANRQPANAVGEVTIRGANVTHGCTNPDGDDRSFLDGWLRTGDQGYLDTDGYLFLTGRIKELINRGGEKISPPEIDNVLASHPAVSQAAAFGVQHPTLGEEVMAAVILRPGFVSDPEEIRQFAVQRLGDFKVPRQIFLVDELPTSPSGKIQRIKLADFLAYQLQPPFIAPEGERERVLARIVADVLGIEQVGRRENFFALGGDSLRAFQVLARIRSAFDVNLSIATIFRRATIAELADEVQHIKNRTLLDECQTDQETTE